MKNIKSEDDEDKAKNESSNYNHGFHMASLIWTLMRAPVENVVGCLLAILSEKAIRSDESEPNRLSPPTACSAPTTYKEWLMNRAVVNARAVPPGGGGIAMTLRRMFEP